MHNAPSMHYRGVFHIFNLKLTKEKRSKKEKLHMMMIVICKHILFYKPKGLCQRAERSKPKLLAHRIAYRYMQLIKNLTLGCKKRKGRGENKIMFLDPRLRDLFDL
jgi:hypothetical protein